MQEKNPATKEHMYDFIYMKCPGKSIETKNSSAGYLELKKMKKDVTAKGQGFLFKMIKMF